MTVRRIKTPTFKTLVAKISLVAIVLFTSMYSKAQLPEYLALENPTILSTRIAAGGRVWNTLNKELVLSVDYKVSLTTSTIYFSDSTNTFIHSSTDGHLIRQIPGKKFLYNQFSALLWNYSGNTFKAYSETGEAITSFTVTATNIYAFQNEIRFVRNNSIYKRTFGSTDEQSPGNFIGTFSTWFMDGEYFLTVQGTIVRLYNKEATLIKLVDASTTEIIGGNGKYFWTYAKNLNTILPLSLYRVDENTVATYPLSITPTVIANPKKIAILSYGVRKFSIISLNEAGPVVTTHSGAGPFLRSFNSDLDGNWTTANQSGVVNYAAPGDEPTVLNLGQVRSMSGSKRGHLAISTSSGHLITYDFNGAIINLVDTIAVNVGKVKMSSDGKYVAASGNTSDYQYSDDELSLYLYEIPSQSLVKKWYYNYFHDNSSSYLSDFDLSADGSIVGQKTGTANGATSSSVSFLSNVISGDSIFLNDDGNIEAPMISWSGSHALTSAYGNENNSTPEFSKLYATDGTLLNAFDGFLAGWISDDKFIFNRIDSIPCHRLNCTKYYSTKVYSIDGQVDPSYTLPDSIFNGTQMVKTSPLSDVITISDVEIFSHSNVINISTGKVLFSFDTIPAVSTPVGSDSIAFIKNNRIQIINWRLQPRIWYKDGDKDGFGDPAVSKISDEKPAGYVKNAGDCDDSDRAINPNVAWYRDEDGDGFGGPYPAVVQCEKPTGFVDNNHDCKDDDADATPLNDCIVTGVDDFDLTLGIFPNPGNGIFNVRHNGKTYAFVLYNQMGQVIPARSSRDDEYYVIDISTETKGLYILNANTGGRNIHYKLIKN